MKNKLRGFALLELLGAIAVGTIMLIGLTSMIDSSLDDVKGQQAALYQSQVYNAAVQYIQTNYSSLIGTVGQTTSTVIPLSSLTNPGGGVAPYLPPNFATTNAYGQSTCILVLQPANNQLQALVVTSGGPPKVVSDAELSTAAANSGQGGGYISNINWSTAQGSTWSLNSTQLTPFVNSPCLTGTSADGGHLASAIFFNGPGQLSTDYLYRSAVPNRPELNTMQTPLDLAGNAVVTLGQGCGTTAGLAADASNNIMNCDGASHTWQPISTWKPPVATYDSLPTTDQPGDVRMATDVNRAFTMAADHTWVALAIDQNGNFTVPNNPTGGGNINAAGYITAGTYITATTNISAGQDLSAGHNLTVAHDANITNTMTADGIDATSWAAAPGWGTEAVMPIGTACNYWNGQYNEDGSQTIIWPTGSIAKDANGVAVSCYSDNTFHYENGGTTLPPVAAN